MQVERLEDGAEVWLDPMRDVRSVAVSVTAAAGSADEPPGELGSTHFLEHLLFKRTRRRSGPAIARMTDRLGGDCDAFTSKESVTFHARTTSDHVGEGLELLCDLTEAPAFTAEDVELERAVILEEMAEASDVPEDRLHDDFVREFWPDHPLGAPILGTRESVGGLTRRSLAAWFREAFRPQRTVWVAVGAFEPRRLLDLLARLRSRRGPRPLSARPSRPAPRRRRRPRPVRCALHVPRPDLSQTHLLLGAPAPPQADPLVPAAWIVSTVLGGGVSSRLWSEVRERRGLAYHVGTSLSLHREAGLALLEAATAPAKLPSLVRTVGRTLARLSAAGVGRAELSRAKDQIRSEIALSLESTVARREAAMRDWLYRGEPYGADGLLRDVLAVTASDVEEAVGTVWGAVGRYGIGVTGPDLAGASLADLSGELAA
ncbi:MAG: insulinase family protein [Acidobacteria bacterium]|nr:MAG: insulinase family protein [Acidobacteriota bacterium]